MFIFVIEVFFNFIMENIGIVISFENRMDIMISDLCYLLLSIGF